MGNTIIPQNIVVFQQGGTSGAPLRYCSLCGKPEHGTIACANAEVILWI